MWLDALMAHIFPSLHHPKMEHFVNRRSIHSINVQVSVFALSRSYVMLHVITNAEAKWPGSVHDSRIYRESTLSNRLECG
ncbi:hypothetical protein QTP70_034479, partial [Hemibagrus guttatus]